MWLHSATLEHWPTPKDRATLHASEKKTVLVGRNGAGKSLLLEGIYWGTQVATAGHVPYTSARSARLAQSFTCTLAVGDPDRLVTYNSRIHYDASDLRRQEPHHSEACFHTETQQPIWSVKNGVAHLPDGSKMPVPRGLGLLSFDVSIVSKFEVSAAVHGFFSQTRRIDPGLPRQTLLPHLSYGERTSEFVVIDDEQAGLKSFGRLGRLSTALTQAWLARNDIWREFELLCRQIGIAQSVTIEVTRSPDAHRKLAFVQFDGVNIGAIADGTLRTAEILWTLLTLGDSGLLLIEEPETGIHPGLLKRLLAVIDSYALDHQILVSTHSMQVVNWARPEEIRLVERSKNVTSARPLSGRQLERLGTYLDDEGSLGDFVYGGGAED